MWNDLAATPAHPEPRVGHYELLETIGQGSFGKVRVARHILTGTEVAVKAIPKKQGFFSRPRLHVQEADSLALLRHPNIVQLFEVIVTRHVVYIVMEHVTGGDLRQYMQAHGELSETKARDVFRQLVSAVHHCHSRGIVHRDLKPNNVLLEADLKVKVADFGLSAPFTRRTLSTFCGTLCYVAPEVFLGQEYDGPPVDVWSLGVILFKMVSGHVPFQEEDPAKLKEQILKGDYTMPFYFTSSLQHLVTKLVTLDPRNRKSLEDFMTDAWLNMFEDLTPYREPPPEDVDPRVIQEMVDMGFNLDLIKDTLSKNTYNYIMGTYLLLKRSQPEVHYRTIRVRPFQSPDDNSPGPSPAHEAQPAGSSPQQTEQQSQDRAPGQMAQEAAGSTASSTSRTTTPGPSPKPTTATPRASRKSSTPTPGPSPKLSKASPRPSQKWAKVIPRHSPKSRTPTPRPSPKSRTATSTPGPKRKKASPHNFQDPSKSRPATPPPIQHSETRPATPPPVQHSETRPATPPPVQKSESQTTIPPPIQESESRPGTPRTFQDSDARITTPPANPDSELQTTVAPLIPEWKLRIATPPPSPESRNTSPSPAPQCGPGDTQSGQSSSSSSSSSESQSPEATRQGRRGVARRCLAWFQKLRLCPCMKGRGKRNRVTPL